MTEFRLFPSPDRKRLILAGFLFAAWIASTTGLRHDLAEWASCPVLSGLLPSFLAAICCAFWISGTQGTNDGLSSVLGSLVSASAEAAQFVVAGTPDSGDVFAAFFGGAVSFPLLKAISTVEVMQACVKGVR